MPQMGNFIGYARNEHDYTGGMLDLNNTSDKIPSHNLSLYLDARNPLSYPGSGTTWTSLVGAENATLSGVTYISTYNGGVLTTTGDLFSIGTGYNYTSESFSFCGWIMFFSHLTAGVVTNNHFFWKGNFQENGYYFQLTSSIRKLQFFTSQSGAAQVTTSSEIRIGTWYNIAVTRSGSSVKIYANGSDITETSATHINPASAGTNTFILAGYNGSGSGNFRIAQFLHYTKELSELEVKQIYNASKWRFGY